MRAGVFAIPIAVRAQPASTTTTTGMNIGGGTSVQLTRGLRIRSVLWSVSFTSLDKELAEL